jgi:L-ascorbate metabolism protein UlaG (beta-lactamase superfamily)
MKIKHYLYNAFLIENGNKKIAIDPGLNLWMFKLGSLIPKSEWPEVTHVLATHGDPDHYWYADKVALASDAPLILGKDMVNNEGDKTFILDPRGKGIPFTTPLEKVHPMEFGDIIEVDEVKFEAIKSVHGELYFKYFFGLATFRETPAPGERIGLGATAYKITFDGKTIVNIGDSLFQEEWKDLEGMRPDVLMLPIGGRVVPNTIDEREALELVKILSPRLVIPCHYSGDFFFIKNGNPADDIMFKREVEKMGIECAIMNYGDEIII